MSQSRENQRHELRSVIERATRFPVSKLEVRLGALEAGRVINISGGGLAVETEKYLRIGKAYPVRLKGPSGRARLDATVVWSRLIRTVVVNSLDVRSIYMVGMSFSSMSASQRRQLEEIIQDEVAAAESGAEADDAASA
ncbi:MAG: PilZ domain-containing protein [Thermoanaerobaculia bacterium]